MSRPPLHELETLARRAIDALAASPGRRRAMREELLSHLYESSAEEASRPGARPADAVAAAARRLGDPADLRRQLQSSVPFVERLFFRLISRKESPMSRWIWLLGVFAFLFGMSMILPDLAQLKQGTLLAHRGLPAVVLLSAVALSLTLGGLGTIAYGVVNRLRRRAA